MILIEETDPRFRYDESTLPNAGFGCFAKQLIKKGDWLEVMGVMVRQGSVTDLCTHYARRYKFAGTKADAKIVPMGWAALVNHTNDKTLQNCEIRHIRGLKKRSEHSSEIVYYFLRDVQPGEEVIGNYGDQIGGEVQQTLENVGYAEANKADWDLFLSYDLYDLKRLCDLL